LLGWIAATFCLPVKRRAIGANGDAKKSRLIGDLPKAQPFRRNAPVAGEIGRASGRRRHEGSWLSEDSLFDLCGCLLCFGDCVFGGAFPLTGMRAVLAAASASKRLSALRSVTVVLLIDQGTLQVL
jgi:hypothetical protein